MLIDTTKLHVWNFVIIEWGMNGQIRKYEGVEGYEGVVPISTQWSHLNQNKSVMMHLSLEAI